MSKRGSSHKPPQQHLPDWDTPTSPSLLIAPLDKSNHPALYMASPPVTYARGVSVTTLKQHQPQCGTPRSPCLRVAPRGKRHSFCPVHGVTACYLRQRVCFLTPKSNNSPIPPQQLPPDWDIPKSPCLRVALLTEWHSPAPCMASPPVASAKGGYSVPVSKR